jgi:hypothetical protein
MGGREDGNGGSMLEIVDVVVVLAGGVGWGGHDSNNDRKLREKRKRGEKGEIVVRTDYIYQTHDPPVGHIPLHSPSSGSGSRGSTITGNSIRS